MDTTSLLTTSKIELLFLHDNKLHEIVDNCTAATGCDNQSVVPRVFRSPPLQIEDYVTIPLYALIFVLSVVGNILVIITLIQNKRMHTVTNVFLLNLSISDLLLAVFCMPFTIIPIMLKNFIFGQAVCVMIRYLQGVSVSVSCFTLVAISLERYFAICQPLHSRKWQTLSHSYKTIIFCWFCALVTCIPISVFTKYRAMPQGNATCREIWLNASWHKAYTIFLDFVLLIAPVFVMILSYGNIVYIFWTGMVIDQQVTETENGVSHTAESLRLQERKVGRSEKNQAGTKPVKLRFTTMGSIRQSNNKKSKEAKKRVIKMLFVIVIEFFILWTPLHVITTWMTVDIDHATTYLSQSIRTGCFLLAYISSCCNPITYCFMNKNFRNGFKAAFRCSFSSRLRWKRQVIPTVLYQSSGSRTQSSHMNILDRMNSMKNSTLF